MTCFIYQGYDNPEQVIIFSDADNYDKAFEEICNARQNIFGDLDHTRLKIILQNRLFPHVILGSRTNEPYRASRYLQMGNKDMLEKAIKDQMKEQSSTTENISSENTSSENTSSTKNCTRCGRANTWHPVCPTCRKIMLRDELIIKLTFLVEFMMKHQFNFDFFSIIKPEIMKVCGLSEEEFNNQMNKMRASLLNAVTRRL